MIVKPSNRKLIFFSKREVIHTYKLKDGTEAVYQTTPRSHGRALFNLLVFEKNGWKYILSVDKRIEDKVPANDLVEIAESVIVKYPVKVNPLE